MGLARAASRVVTLSIDRISICGVAVAYGSVVLPDCRGPAISIMRVSDRRSRSFASRNLGQIAPPGVGRSIGRFPRIEIHHWEN
jgi:hypothetical protein